LKYRAAVTAGTEGTVDVATVLNNGQLLQHFGEKDRRVAGRSASTLT
jgi:hypothetical protein